MSTLLSAFSDWLGRSLQMANFFVSLAVLSTLFAMLFRWFPDVDVSWRYVLLVASSPPPVRHWQAWHRFVHWHAGIGIDLRRRSIRRGAACMGVLFRADCPLWRLSNPRACDA